MRLRKYELQTLDLNKAKMALIGAHLFGRFFWMILWILSRSFRSIFKSIGPIPKRVSTTVQAESGVFMKRHGFDPF